MALAGRHAAGADGGHEVGQRALEADEALRVPARPAPGATAVTPSASTRGARSPSQVALPRSPTARQRPVHDVRNPSAAQLPVNANRSSSLIRNTAWAAAGPAYQLHGGL